LKLTGHLDDNHTYGGRKKMRNSLAVISFALLPIAIILTFVSTSLVHYLPSTLDVYLQFNIKSVEASKAATTTTTNTTSAADAPQSATTRSYVNPVFGISVKYPSTWSAFDLNARFRDNATYAVALLRSPLENASDKYAERVNFAMQKMKLNNMTLDAYTSKILDGYRNATGIKIQDSAATTLGGQPAHRIVYTDDSVKDNKLKKIQVWTVVNNSKAYVITFGAEESKYNDYLSDVQNILSSFKITGGSSDNPSQEQRNLTFDDPMSGVKLEYPSSWTKIQPGQPSAQSNIDLVAAFLRPEIQNTSSISRIGIGVQDLRQDVKLDQYTPNQINAIKRVNATILENGETKIANNPGHKAVFTLENGKKVMQMWTLKGNKAYIMAYQASPNEYSTNLPTFEKMVQSLEIK